MEIIGSGIDLDRVVKSVKGALKVERENVDVVGVGVMNVNAIIAINDAKKIRRGDQEAAKGNTESAVQVAVVPLAVPAPKKSSSRVKAREIKLNLKTMKNQCYHQNNQRML